MAELINSQKTWLFLGSGASAQAGLPSWPKLLSNVVAGLPPDAASRVRASSRYVKALENHEYPRAFEVVQSVSNRGTLEHLVARELATVTTPPPVIKMLANWPFAGYITSNYDGLLMRALRAIQDYAQAWTAVGNTPQEMQKLTGDQQRRVWHIHGAFELPEKSRLILTESDYEEAYAEGSPALHVLRAILATRRLVFIGFGFNDLHLLKVLTAVSRLTGPARPIVAVLPDSISDEKRYALTNQSNIDVYLYPHADATHEKLNEFVQLHDYLIYTRSHKLREPSLPCPSFDEETTGLLLYNELCLRDSARVRDDVLLPLLEMKVLAHLSANPVVSTQELAADLQGRVAAIRGPGVRLDETSGMALEMTNALVRLHQAGLIDLVEGANVRLTAKGLDVVANKRTMAETFSDGFTSSILGRVEREAPALNPVAVHRIQKTTEAFIKDSVRRRALAVATAFSTSNQEHKQSSVVGLLQHLRDYINTMYSAEEALPLIRSIIGVLLEPTPSEKKYISVLLQASFATSLLGLEAGAVRARVREIEETAFILDASVLVPYFAVGSNGHNAARSLVESLKELGCSVFTTLDFVREVTANAVTARNYYRGDNVQSVRTFERARSGAGRQNAFVEGFQRSSTTMIRHSGMVVYLSSRCGLRLIPGGKKENVGVVKDALIGAGIGILDASDLDPEAKQRASAYERTIRSWRESKATANHPEQSLAEANAAVFVENIRARREARVACTRSYFVTSTMIVDSLAAERVAFSPDALLQFVITLRGWSPDEMDVLGSNLFSEMMERSLVLLSSSQIATIFLPLVDLSAEAFARTTERYRTLLLAKWGSAEVESWSRVSPADLPILNERVHYQLLEQMERENIRLKALGEKGAERSQLSREEQNELARYRAKARDRSKKKLNRRGPAKKSALPPRGEPDA